MNRFIDITQSTQALWHELISKVSSETVLSKQVEIQMLWQQSPYCAQICSKHPEWLVNLIENNSQDYQEKIFHQNSESLINNLSKEEFKQHSRYLRHQCYLYICWNDLVEQQDIFTVLKQQSDLADRCMALAVAWARQAMMEKYGVARNQQDDEVHLVVIAMGKLGGHELNFSSDIDVIFCYSDAGQTDGKTSLSNSEYFTKLAQLIIQLISEVTIDGFIYRVDCRLRPFGDSGPLVVNFNHIEDYLHTHGREWERYAYVKARVMCGTANDKYLFDQMVESFVYRRYIDFGVIHTLREMKNLIAQQVIKKGNLDNIKLGVGGIREIEFIVQFFQLVHGGRQPNLRTRKIIEGLEQIQLAGYLDVFEVEALLNAYKFLRRVENRLQMVDDMQTHTLPNEEHAKRLLTQSMGYQNDTHFELELQRHRRRVNQIFNEIHAESDASSEDEIYAQLWEKLTSLDQQESIDNTQYADFNEFAEVVNKLQQLINSSAYRLQDQEGRQRLALFMPLFLRELKKVQAPGIVIGRLFLLLQNILRRSVYLVLLSENNEVLKKLIAVATASPWIASHISTYPLLLDELVVSSEQSNLLTKEITALQFNAEILSNKALDYDSILDRVRVFKHARELQIACADVLGETSIMKVSDQLSWTAEVVVDGCVKYLEQQFDPIMQGNLAVIAFGKLGGIELSYGSDLDLVYISNNENEIDYPADIKVPYIVKATKFAQRLTQMLTLQTVSGKLYDVDTRLRPDGESGPMVPFFSFVNDYYKTRAWTWEIQALVRARCISSSVQMNEKFTQLRKNIICQPRDKNELARDVIDMRMKMLETKASKLPGVFHLKNDKGGITDIEFMVQYAILAHAYKDMDLCEYSDNVRLLERLAGGGFIPSSIAKEITDIYCQFRNIMHRTALQDSKPEVSEKDYELERNTVRRCWNEILDES